ISVFKLPASVCDELTRMIRQYWRGVENGKKMAWMSWDRLRLPKPMGGMGFKDMRAFNQALLAKQAWHLIDTPDSLCARLMKARYYPSGQLLHTAFSGNGSSVWKGILHGLDLLKRGVIWRVGNGADIRTWRDPWIPRPSSFRPITPKEPPFLLVVADFIDDNGAWRVDRHREFFWPMDVDYILIRTSPRNRDDFVSWFPEKCGAFTVRSAYKLATCDHNVAFANGSSSSNPEGNRSVWNRIWSANVPRK
uniref:Reverse transcriptase zinc-binding domain-containing protein n=1 Tax=Aegilops tauschii subsp. strangulata TaxID=200361 RepID=A0A453MYJ1_AEGTS